MICPLPIVAEGGNQQTPPGMSLLGASADCSSNDSPAKPSRRSYGLDVPAPSVLLAKASLRILSGSPTLPLLFFVRHPRSVLGHARAAGELPAHTLRKARRFGGLHRKRLPPIWLVLRRGGRRRATDGGSRCRPPTHIKVRLCRIRSKRRNHAPRCVLCAKRSAGSRLSRRANAGTGYAPSAVSRRDVENRIVVRDKWEIGQIPMEEACHCPAPVPSLPLQRWR